MRVLVFGASGFIGNYLVNYLVKRNYFVIEASRSDFVSNPNSKKLKWSLGDKVPNAFFKNIDFVIHLAHDFNGIRGAKLTKINILLLIKQARKMGVPRQLFFSSYSAGAHSNSIYGLTKFEIERHIKSEDLDVQILRPGLVIGSGGIYGKISRYAQKMPVVFLPDGGKGLVPTISINTLCNEVLSIMKKKRPKREYNLFHSKLKSLKSLIESEMMKEWKYVLIINIPSSLLIFLLQIAELINLALPIHSDNLKGFLRNQNALHASDLKDQDEKYF